MPKSKNRLSDADRDLLLACEIGDLTLLNSALRGEANINVQSLRDGKSALHFAAARGDIDGNQEIMERLFVAGIDIDLKTQNGVIAEGLAPEDTWAKGSLDLIRSFSILPTKELERGDMAGLEESKGIIQDGIKNFPGLTKKMVNYQNEQGESLLDVAQKFGDKTGFIDLLLKAGAQEAQPREISAGQAAAVATYETGLDGDFGGAAAAVETPKAERKSRFAGLMGRGREERAAAAATYETELPSGAGDFGTGKEPLLGGEAATSGHHYETDASAVFGDDRPSSDARPGRSPSPTGGAAALDDGGKGRPGMSIGGDDNSDIEC